MMSRKILIIFGISFVVSFFFFLSRFIIVGCGIHGDGVLYYSNLRSLVFDRDFDITNEIEYFATSVSKISNKPRASPSEDSPTYSLFPNGLSLLWLPFYILGHIISYILVEVFGLNLRLDGFGILYEFMVCLGSFIYGSLGLILAYKLLNKFFSKNISLLAVLGIWFATSFTYYYMIDPSMSHNCAFFVVNLFLYIFFTKKKNYLTASLLGVVSGIGILIRPQDISLLIVPLIDMFIRRKNFLFYFLLITVAFCVCIPQILIYKNLFGSIYNMPNLKLVETGGFLYNLLHPYIHKILFSSGRGLFTWTPITLPAIIALFISIKRFRLISLFLLVFFLVEVYIAATYARPQLHSVAAALNLSIKEALDMDIGVPPSSFGMRYLISCGLCFMFGLASLLFYLKRYKLIYKISLIFIGILIIHNILFIFQYLLETFPINGRINFWEILKNDFFIVFKLISTLREIILR